MIPSVLTDVVTVLLHPRLLDELFLPQPVATHAVLKQLLQDISTTSIMRLDDYSMSKLWDLMTMILKWQLSVATNQNIFDITRRHLNSAATLLPPYFPKSLIEQAMHRFDLLVQKFSNDDYKCLNNTLILWFSEYHTKISVLLRLGLQKKDGTFSLPATINFNILQNLGNNIYQYDNKRNPVEEYEQRCCADASEISCMLETIEKIGSKHNIELYLPIQLGNDDGKCRKMVKIDCNTHFENIDTNIITKNSDLTFIPKIPKSANDDLLEMMKNES